MSIDVIVYETLSYVGFLSGLVCGGYVLKVALKFKEDEVIKRNMIGMGLVQVAMGIIYLLAILHVDGLAMVSNFSKVMRPLTLLLILFPTLICYRMGMNK